MKYSIFVLLVLTVVSLGTIHAQTIQYRYNQQGLLTEVIYPDSSRIVYYHDKNGNRTTMNAQVSPANLPVEFLLFTGNPVSDSMIQLQWQVLENSQNAGYSLERSQDGGFFTQIAWVSVASNPEGLHAYSYNDEKVVPGNTYFYRLKQVDLDGGFIYSNIVEITANRPAQTFQIKIYPNPTADEFVLELQNYSLQTNSFNYSLIDIQGRAVISREASIGIGTTLSIPIDVSMINPGIYEVRVVFPHQETLSKKLVVE